MNWVHVFALLIYLCCNIIISISSSSIVIIT